MSDGRLPNWARAIIAISALMQLVFGLSLLQDPGRIAEIWPWPLPPLSARLLGASTLVSVPMALLVVWINRFVVAMIPLVMMLTYRVLQLIAGIIHADRFDPASLVTANYFGGGILMMAVFGYCLWAGLTGRLPPATHGARLATALPWDPPSGVRGAMRGLAVAYVLLGLWFLFAGGSAASFWIDDGGLTPLTARLFASPLIGLGLGLWLSAGATDWRAVFVPGVGLVTIGLAGTLSLALDRDQIVLPTIVAWLVAATPLILLIVGGGLLASRPELRARRAE
jgi:hypothetical protein